MRNVTIAAVLLCCSIHLTCAVPPIRSVRRYLRTDPGIRRVIQLNREVYFVREPIWMTYYMLNSTSDIQYWRVWEGHQVDVANIIGGAIRYRGPYDPHGPIVVDGATGEEMRCPEGGWRELQPGERSKEMTQNLLDMYGEGSFSDLHISPGEYTLQGKPPIESNVVTFKVIQPPTEEKQRAHDLLMEGHKKCRRAESADWCEYYGEIVEEHPDSRYAPLAFRRMITVWSLSHVDFVEEAEEFIERFTESPFAVEVTNSIIGYYLNTRNPSGIGPVMQRLVDKYRNTDVGEYAYGVLKRAQSGEYQEQVQRWEEAERRERSYQNPSSSEE